MVTYEYEAMDAQGREVRNVVEANSEAEAAEKIRALSYLPTRIRQKGRAAVKSGKSPKKTGAPAQTKKKGGIVLFKARLSQKKLTAFTRQFAILLDAGLPVVRSLSILHNQMPVSVLADAVGSIKDDVESGSSLSEAMNKHPRVFDKLYVNMVRAGEVGGVLDTILARLADFREKSQLVRRKVIGALIYPAVVTLIATALLVAIMMFIIPQFEKMFKEMDVPGGLPPMTTMLIAVATMIRDFWYIIIFLPLLLFVALKLIGKNPKGRLAIDLVKLHLPVFGIITSKSSISRFARTLGTLLQSGVPILDALAIIKGATGNAVVAQAVENVHNSIREGDTVHEPLRHSGVFDELVVNMIQVGEETGELDKMLLKISDNYDGEVDALVSGLMSLLEPFLIVFMGGAVGFIVIALFLPLIKLLESIKS